MLCYGTELVIPDTTSPPRPSRKLVAEDRRMRSLAKSVMEKGQDPPTNLLWPYYQNELLDATGGCLDPETMGSAVKSMERDAGLDKAYMKHFYW